MQRPVSEIQPLIQPESHELIAALAITFYREHPTADQLGEALAAFIVTMPRIVREAFDRHFARFEALEQDPGDRTVGSESELRTIAKRLGEQARHLPSAPKEGEKVDVTKAFQTLLGVNQSPFDGEPGPDDGR